MIVQEEIIEINTGLGLNSFTTNLIEGVIKSFIFQSSNPVDFFIDSELGYNIFRKLQHEGTEYIAIGINPLDKEAHRMNFVNSELLVKERLIVTIQGAEQISGKVIIRYI